MATNFASVNEHRWNLVKSLGTPYVFISYRLADRDAAEATTTLLVEEASINVYCSERDANLKEAVETGNDERLVDCIERGLWPATRLLGIISGNTRCSWWVPFEFGLARHKEIPIALLLLENVAELPSYMKLPTVTVIKDSIELFNWVDAMSPELALHLRLKGSYSDVPRLPLVRTAAPIYR